MVSKIRLILAQALAVACIAAITPSFGQEVSVQEALRVEVERLGHDGQRNIGGVPFAANDLVATVYERRSYQPAWTRTEQVGELVVALEAAYNDGLDPNDYHIDAVRAAYRDLDGGRQMDARARAAMDLLLTESLIRLGYHERFGKVDADSLDPNWNFVREFNNADPATVVQRGIDSDSLTGFLAELFPRRPIYVRSRAALVAYREIEAAGGWPQIPEGATLRPGATDERLSLLAQRLTVTGDIEQVNTFAPISNYDARLEEGVKRFQARHDLSADGIVGPDTLRALNVPVEKRIDQLRLTLERGRWVLDQLGDRFVVVNIAAFKAYLSLDNVIVWSTKVQVGRTYHQTPVFRDEMTYVVFNPTWTVPYSIATKEMLPKIKQDPDYFNKRDFDVKNRSGELVDPNSVDWSQVTRGNFGYTFIQRPGPRNALGRVKFIFPNQHSVYLHDTPSKYLFGQDSRAFSHGCIRVENPFDFAEVLLGPDGWDRMRIDALIESRETKTEFLSDPLPVLLLYWTADVGADGVVHFYEDVYERDQRLLDALNTPFDL